MEQLEQLEHQAISVARRLAQYACGLEFRSLPEVVIHEAKRHIIDALGCAFGAFAAEPVKIARSMAQEFGGRAQARVIGAHLATSAPLATFINGLMIRYLDYNDTYLSKEPAHPSDNIAAALAVADAAGRSGKDLLTAVILAYEVQCRLADAASIRARGWDHVTYGAFSTAAAAAKLLGLGAEQVEQALNLSGVANVALRQTRAGELSMWKGAAFANVARNGVFAAYLARAGMTGPAPLFEGEMGFFRQVSGEFALDRLGGERSSAPEGSIPEWSVPGGVSKGVAADVAEGQFKIMETSIKFYPAEYHAQAGIEAAVALKREGVRIENVAEIMVHTFRAAVEIIGKDPEKWRPRTRETADHSLPYCVAVALADGTVQEKQFTPERIGDPRLQEFLGKIRLVEDPALTEGYPAGIPTVLDVQLQTGQRLRKRVDFPRGHAKNPMSDAELGAKFLRLTGWVLAPSQQEEALTRLWRLENEPDLARLWAALVV